MINILPEFESRQVLTSDELNWLTCYLDNQNRQSRRMLIGCGLISGLQVKLMNNSIQITNGCGLTSAGHIVSLHAQNNPVTYTKIKKYTQKNKEKLAFHYLSDLNTEDTNYTKSVDVQSVYFPNFKNDVFELFEETVNGPDKIVSSNVNGKIAVLFAEIIQKELKDCEEDNCQERGKKYIFNTKVLLISKEDALTLLKQEYQIASDNENDIIKKAFPWLHLPGINILKPVFSNINIANGFSEAIILQEYTRCIKDFTDEVFKIRTVIDESLNSIRNYCGTQNGSVNFVQPLIDLVNKLITTNNNKTAFQVQLMYDFLWKFVNAYHELHLSVQALRSRCHVNEDAFPNHILLGVVENQNVDFDACISTSDKIYRHGFHAKYIQTEQSLLSKKITILLNRLQQLAINFDETIFVTAKEIKINSGGNLQQPLSLQVVPYYYKPSVLNVWNQFSTHPNLKNYNTNYNAVNENQTASVALLYNTLPNAFQSNNTFFRIEAAHGKDSLTALNTVFQLRKKHGLAFEVLMLRLNEDAPFNHSFNFTINEDIESIYQIVRAELLKQIALNTSYLGALQLKSGKFDSIKSSLVDALKKSYKFFLDNLHVGGILAQPMVFELSDAITASNIVLNNKAKTIAAEPKFKELETFVKDSKAANSSASFKTNKELLSFKPAFAINDLVQIDLGFNFNIGLLFLNTLGNLVSTIRNSNDFKSTSDISFYTHLLSVSKSMQKNEKEEVLFLLALQLYCALQLQNEYLLDNFLEFDVTNYSKNLNSELLPACNAVITYLKKNQPDFVRNDAILSEVIKGEMLDYADRIKFDDDWIKIVQIDTENKKRNGGLGVENLLERFVKLHPGIAHGCGVPQGGTFIMVYDKKNTVIADFYLPYIISSHLRPIQYTLLENKTITISGTVSDTNGNPLEASLKIGEATVFSNKSGFYNCLVDGNAKIKINCTANGFAAFEKELDVKDASQTLDIKLTAQVTQKTSTIKFIFSGDPIKTDIKLFNETSQKDETAVKGVLTISDLPNTKISYSIKDENFETLKFEVTVGDADKEEIVTLKKVGVLKIQIIDKASSKFNQSLLKSIKIKEDATIEFELKDADKGILFSKQKIDLTKQLTATIIYNNLTKVQTINASNEINEVTFEAVVTQPIETKDISSIIAVRYAATLLGVLNKMDAINLNGKKIKLDPQTNIGSSKITSNGTLILDAQFVNAPVVPVPNFKTINAVIILFSSKIITGKTDVTKNKCLLTFNKSLTAIELRKIITVIPEFRTISAQTDLKLENFYCFIMNADELAVIKQTFNV